MIAVDAEMRSQLLAFGLMKNQSMKSFTQFFQYVKNILEEDPRIITVDKCKGKLASLKGDFLKINNRFL